MRQPRVVKDIRQVKIRVNNEELEATNLSNGVIFAAMDVYTLRT